MRGVSTLNPCSSALAARSTRTVLRGHPRPAIPAREAIPANALGIAGRTCPAIFRAAWARASTHASREPPTEIAGHPRPTIPRGRTARADAEKALPEGWGIKGQARPAIALSRDVLAGERGIEGLKRPAIVEPFFPPGDRNQPAAQTRQIQGRSCPRIGSTQRPMRPGRTRAQDQ